MPKARAHFVAIVLLMMATVQCMRSSEQWLYTGNSSAERQKALAAIGAVGIARCFAFGAAKAPDRGLHGSIEHFEEKLVKIEGMMKTDAGKELARERTAKG